MKNRCAVSRTAVEVTFVCHGTDANQFPGQRNVPEPAFVGEVSDRSGAFVKPGIAQRSLVVSPDGDFIQVRVADLPSVAGDREGIAATSINSYRSLEFLSLAVLADRLDSSYSAILSKHLPDRRLLPHFSALGTGVVEEHLVELPAQNLPGAGRFMLQVGKKIKWVSRPAVAVYELHAVFPGEPGGLHPVDKPQALERKVRVRKQRLANVITGKFFLFQ